MPFLAENGRFRSKTVLFRPKTPLSGTETPEWVADLIKSDTDQTKSVATSIKSAADQTKSGTDQTKSVTILIKSVADQTKSEAGQTEAVVILIKSIADQTKAGTILSKFVAILTRIGTDQTKTVADQTKPLAEFSAAARRLSHCSSYSLTAPRDPSPPMPPTPRTWDGTDTVGAALKWDGPGITWDSFLRDNPNQNPTPKKMPQQRVLLGFAAASDHAVEERAQTVLDHLYVGAGLAAYPTPPVTAVNLGAALAVFSEAIAAVTAGGPADTAMKENKRSELITLLRQLVSYVQGHHGNDLAKLFESGFDAASTNTAPAPLATPSIVKIVHGMSGQLASTLTRIPNARSYELRYALVDANGTPGPMQNGGLHGSSRALTVSGLTPGAVYQIQARAVGGSTGYSNWNDPVSHRCM